MARGILLLYQRFGMRCRFYKRMEKSVMKRIKSLSLYLVINILDFYVLPLLN